jgi:hypothetical protein
MSREQGAGSGEQGADNIVNCSLLGAALVATPVRRAGPRRYGARGGMPDTPVGAGRCHPWGWVGATCGSGSMPLG